MEITQLMIGDWYYWEAEEKKYPLQVTKETFTLFDEDIANFEPIPLTSEILEKNGFKHLQDTYLFHINTNQFGFDLWLEIGPDSWIENNKIYINSLKGDSDYKMLPVKTCKYVHEFQHELKSYGIKKEIVL